MARKITRRRAMAAYRRMGRRTRHHSGFTIPVACIAGFAPLTYAVYAGVKEGGVQRGIRLLSSYTTGYDPEAMKWSATDLIKGMGPVFLGFVVHMLASRLGINRALGRAKIPVLRI